LKGEGDLGKGQRGKREVMLDMRRLGLLGAKEFPARRQVIEQYSTFMQLKDIRIKKLLQ
jgi:hypothetical protein